MTRTEFALNFLCKRNPFDDTPQSDYVFALMNFQDNKGDKAIECLAGFYIYAIDKISYHEFWINECGKYTNENKQQNNK